MAYLDRSLSRRDAARILDGQRRGTGSPLAALITLATAPGSSGELGHEHVAMAAYRSTHAPIVAAVRRDTAFARIWKVVAGAPVAAVATTAVILGGGGVALAAANVPLPFSGHDNRSDNAPAAPSSTNPGQSHPRPTPAHGSPGSKPTKATHPTHPAHPTHPVQPTHPAHPTVAATPTHPSHPTEAATPTKKPHPAKPSSAATGNGRTER